MTTAPDRRIHVAAGCDANYALPLAVMLASIDANLGPGCHVVAHVLESGLDTAARNRIANSVDPRRVQLEWLRVEPRELAVARGTLRSFDTVSLASYHRLLLPDLLPASLDRVIYLDCDLVVNHDLGALWQIDIGDRSLGAVRELLEEARYASSPSGIRLYRELGLPPRLELFNSGVMLINLARWRETLLARRAFTYLREATIDVRWHDQEALNAVVAGAWAPLDIRWNVTMHAYRRRRDPELLAALAKPHVIHYNSAVKPWQPGFNLARADAFFRYLDATAWSGWRPSPATHSTAQRIAARLLRIGRKRQHAATRQLRRRWLKFGTRLRLQQIDRQTVRPLAALLPVRPIKPELRAFVQWPDDWREPCELPERLRASGVDRVLLSIRAGQAGEVIDRYDNSSTVHVFTRSGDEETRALHLRRLLHRYGEDHWCLVLEGNEWLRAPQESGSSLAKLRDYLEHRGYDAFECLRHPATAAGRPATSRRVDLTLFDPMLGRVFVGPVHARPAAHVATDLDSLSRVAMFRYERNLLLDREFRGIQPARLADIVGWLEPLPQTSWLNSLPSSDRPGEPQAPRS